MNSRKTCTATLLAAVKHASDLSSHLVIHPFDFTVLAPLIKAAKTIGSCAQALRRKDLSDLSEQLVAAAQMDLTTMDGVNALCGTMEQLITIAETYGDVKSAKIPQGGNRLPSDADDPFSSLTGTTWVVL